MNHKFRIWSDYHKKFVVENGEFGLQRLFEDFSATLKGKWSRNEDYNTPSHIGDYKITQWTGLKDKNGQNIYCGDIVSGEFYDTEYHHSKTIEAPVVFNNGAFNISSSNWHKPSLQIVGNIFENPLDEQLKAA